MSTNVILNKFLNKYTTLDFYKDFVNVFLFPADFSGTVANENYSLPKFLRSFFSTLNKELIQYNNENKNIALKFTEACNSLLTIREKGQGLLTYETVGQHYSANNPAVKKLIDDVLNEPIQSEDIFRKKIDQIILNINYFYDFHHALNGMTKIQEFEEDLEKPEVSIIESVEKYKNLSLQLNSDLSLLSTINRDETATDYYTISDPESAKLIGENITNYIWDNYSFYKCGLNAYDKSVDGFESSSVSLIGAPSNHGKSMTLANLFYRIAQSNKDEFTDHDAALYISAEDDLIKTTRKFISIFGNIDYEIVRNMYKKTHDFFNQIKKKGDESLIETAKKSINELFSEILNNSIIKSSKGNLKIIFKYSPENTLSPGDISRQIDKYKHAGINVKYLIIDYLDVLKPTINLSNNFDEYNTLGLITQELRTISRLYGIPVISATQLTRSSEDLTRSLNNGQVGDSWKKVKYSDFIFLQRMHQELNVFSEEVSKYVFDENSDKYNNPQSPEVLAIEQQLINDLKIAEVSVTKSKEKGKGYHTYMLFCSKNLRMYNTVNEYLDDMKEFMVVNTKLNSKINNTIDINSINMDSVPEIFDNDEEI